MSENICDVIFFMSWHMIFIIEQQATLGSLRLHDLIHIYLWAVVLADGFLLLFLAGWLGVTEPYCALSV